jgi:hypothetical protein
MPCIADSALNPLQYRRVGIDVAVIASVDNAEIQQVVFVMDSRVVEYVVQIGDPQLTGVDQKPQKSTALKATFPSS